MSFINSRRMPYIEILGVRVDAVQIPDIIQYMEDCIIKNVLHNYIVVANVDTVIQSKYNLMLKNTVNASSLSIPDGFPLLVMQKMNGNSLKKRAYGPDLMAGFLKETDGNGYSHFFYGATEDTLDKLIRNIKALTSSVNVAGSYSPPFRPLTDAEDKEIVAKINSAKPDVLWVGIGCPKQELWMHKHAGELNVPVMVGVGAAFDFLSGVKPQAPRWLRDNGFEWMFRLVTEPKRLWRRYLINNFLFVYYVAVEAFGRVLTRKCAIKNPKI